MRCANCDAEIKDGSIYCPVCGKEAQMISGYSSLEDDFLLSLLQEKKAPKDTDRTDRGTDKKAVLSEEEKRKEKNRQRMPVLVTGILLAFLILTGVILKMAFDYKNNHSYAYQMQMAEDELTDHNYEHALDYLARALALVPSDVSGRIKMADIYIIKEEYDAAIVLLTEAVKLDKNGKEAYERLIRIYAKQGLYGQIEGLYELAEEEDIKKLFEPYLVEGPVIYPASGSYNTHIAVSMISIEDEPIYYTTDGSNPMEEGKLYTGEIELTSSGFYTIKAVCKNIKSNIYSDVAEYEYQLEVFPPDAPQADSGGKTVFSEPAYITLKANPDCRIYYTWDGSVPTKESAEYSEPIAVPEGTNTLSAVAMDEKTGLCSALMQTEYIYYQ